MYYQPPLTPFVFRDIIIQKGILLKELSSQEDIPLNYLVAACNEQVVPYSIQMKITWALQKGYGVACRRQDLFLTLTI